MKFKNKNIKRKGITLNGVRFSGKKTVSFFLDFATKEQFMFEKVEAPWGFAKQNNNQNYIKRNLK